jgi:hypothetical protein
MSGLEISLKGQLISFDGAKKVISVKVQDSTYSANPGDADTTNPGCIDLTFEPDAESGPVTLRLKIEPMEKALQIVGDLSNDYEEEFDEF